MTTTPAIVPETIDPTVMCTLEELCVSCNVDADWIAQLVEYAIIEPVGQTRSDWRFASLSVVRVAKAKRLGRDLDISPSGLALVLDLLDEIDALRSRLQRMETPAADSLQD
jgi:chaperone modulatory protein CbpM